MIEMIFVLFIFIGCIVFIGIDRYHVYKMLNKIEKEEELLESELHSLAIDVKIKKKIEDKVQELRRNGSVG